MDDYDAYVNRYIVDCVAALAPSVVSCAAAAVQEGLGMWLRRYSRRSSLYRQIQLPMPLA
jgi:hypothetical protein